MANIVTVNDPQIFTELQTLVGLTFGSKLRLVSKVAGFPIYTSDKIANYGLGLCVKKWRNLNSEFTSQVEQGKLIFGIVEKSIFRRILSILGQSPAMTGWVCGFYYPPNDKIYIILSSAATLFSIILESDIPYVIIHEYQHKACGISPQANEFAWSKLYTTWYASFLRALSAIGVLKSDVLADKKVMSYFHALSRNELKKGMQSQFELASQAWKYILGKYMGSHTAAYILHNIVSQNFNVKLNILYNLYTYTYKCYRYAYRKTAEVNGIRINSSDWLTSMYYQELFVPSEVAAITSGMNISNPISVKLMHIGLTK